MSLSTALVRSVTAAPATGRAAAAAAATRWCPQIFLRETSASTRLYVGRRQFVSVNGAVNGASGDDEGPSSDPAASSLAASMQWRRSQIDKLESKFDDKNGGDDDTPDITTDEELQPMWRDMESRVTRRRSLTAAEREPGKVGRRNIRKRDEDVWLASGLYNETEDGEDKKE